MKAILTWHSIDDSGSVISTAASVFAEQVRFLAEGPLRVVSLADLDAAPEGSVALTFDDGFVNFADAAWPRLGEAGLPVTLFVVPGRLGGRNRWDGRPTAGIPDLDLLDAKGVARLAEAGVEIGNHGLEHRRLLELGDQEAADEIGRGAESIARLTGRPPTSYCYAYGLFGDRDRRLAAASHARAVTTEFALRGAGDDSFALPRLDTYYWRRAGALAGLAGRTLGLRVQFIAAARRLRRRLAPPPVLRSPAPERDLDR